MADNIIVTDRPASILNDFLREKSYSQIAVLVDENSRQYCYPLLQPGLPAHELIQVPGGEAHKTLSTCEMIWERMTNLALDRHSLLIIIGGGVLGDMGGFCAATFKRGIDFVLIPTTLLSQVDASIGGKLAVDFKHFKNHIGTFQIPALTIIHDGFLKTLPEAELRSGFAEVIKHALLSDRKTWDEIRQKPLVDQNWAYLLNHSIAFKSRIVSDDPKETGLRKILNAGHTIGHAIETFLLKSGRPILHGDAVAAGLICEAFIAHQKNMLSEISLKEIGLYIGDTFGKIDLRTADFEEIFQLTLQDKKNKSGKVLSVLLEEIGDAKWDVAISQQEVIASLAYYREL